MRAISITAKFKNLWRSIPLILICLVPILLIQGCSEPDISDSEYVARAKDFRDQGELRSSILELKNALRKNPDNPEARWLLGNIYMDIGNGVAAEKELLRASELGVADDAVLPVLLRAMLYQEGYDRALAVDISAISEKKVAAEIHASRGTAYLALNEIDKAREALELSLVLNENSLHALVANARFAATEDNLQGARSLLEKALGIQDSYAPAWSALGDLLRSQRDIEGAITAYTNAIENRFNNASDMLKRAMLLIQQEDYEKAGNNLATLKKRFPKHPGVNYVQGVLLFYQENYQQASAALELSLKANVNEILVLYYLGASQFMLGNREQAKTYINQFIADAPRHIAGRKLAATIALQDQDFSAAERLIRPLVRSLPDDVFAMNILANALSGKGKTKEALDLLEKVVALEPESAAAYTRMSMGLFAEGDTENARGALRSAIELEPEFNQADVMLVLSYLHEGKLELAKKEAEDFVAREPENVLAYNVLGSVYQALKDEAQAKAALQKALELAPGDPAAAGKLARMSLANNDIDATRNLYKSVLDVHPENMVTLLALAELELNEGEPARGFELIKQADEFNPDALEPKIALAQAYLVMGQADQARLVVSRIENEYKRNPYVLGITGSVHMAFGEFVNAKLVFRQLVEMTPEQGQSHFLLAQAFYELEAYDDAMAELNKTLEILPEYKVARYLLVSLLVKQGNVAEARKELALLKADFTSDNVELLVLEGMVNQASGNFTQALAMYRNAFELSPDEKRLMILAKFQWSQEMPDESIALLENWVNEKPASVKVLLVLANNYLGVKRQDEALALYTEVLNKSPENLMALNNLAWYLKGKDIERALGFAEKAAKLAPQSVVVMDTLAMILFEKGELKRAERVMERSLVRYPDDPLLHFHYAVILEKAKGVQTAKDVLEQLLGKHKEFPEREQAVSMLARLKAQP